VLEARFDDNRALSRVWRDVRSQVPREGRLREREKEGASFYKNPLIHLLHKHNHLTDHTSPNPPEQLIQNKIRSNRPAKLSLINKRKIPSIIVPYVDCVLPD
jgi:hypothetical protein